MFESVINFLGSDILYRIMVFIWMMVLIWWMGKIGKDIIEIYRHIRILSTINDEQWKSIQELNNEVRNKKDE